MLAQEVFLNVIGCHGNNGGLVIYHVGEVHSRGHELCVVIYTTVLINVFNTATKIVLVPVNLVTVLANVITEVHTLDGGVDVGPGILDSAVTLVGF